MTMKNAKTILFASLIATMILSFSMADYAEAKEQKMLDDKKQKLIKKVQKLEEQITKTDNETKKERLIAKQQAILKKLFDAVSRSNTEFTKNPTPGTAGQSGGTITVDGIYKGCNGSKPNWNFAAKTYSSSTWWNVKHYFPSSISVGTSPNCSGSDWDNNLYVESREIIGEKGCHANLIVSSVSSYWLNCQHIMNGLIVTKVKVDYEDHPKKITGYHYQFI